MLCLSLAVCCIVFYLIETRNGVEFGQALLRCSVGRHRVWVLDKSDEIGGDHCDE